MQNLPTAAARSKSSQKKKSDGGKRRKDPAVSTAGKDVEIKPCVFPEDHLFPTADVKKWEAKNLQVSSLSPSIISSLLLIIISLRHLLTLYPAPPRLAPPEVHATEVSAPGVSAPEASAPEASAPEASAPEASAPEASAPESVLVCMPVDFKATWG